MEAILIILIGFCLGILTTLLTSTRSALNGWRETLDEWNLTIDTLGNALNKIKELESELAVLKKNNVI